MADSPVVGVRIEDSFIFYEPLSLLATALAVLSITLVVFEIEGLASGIASVLLGSSDVDDLVPCPGVPVLVAATVSRASSDGEAASGTLPCFPVAFSDGRPRRPGMPCRSSS